MTCFSLRAATGFGLVAILALFGGCPQNPGPNNPDPNLDPNAKPRLVPFESQGAWLDYFKTQYNASNSRLAGGFYSGGFGGPAANTAAEDSAGAPSDGSGTSFTTTNVQEAGVDEGDIVKSDGDRFYIARGRSLRIVDATPADAMTEVGRLTLEDYISELYLVGDGKAIVLAQRFDLTPQPYALAAIDIWPPYYARAQAVAYLVDVSDPAAPGIAQRVELDGSRVNSRVVDDRLLLVLSIVPEVPVDATPLFGQPRFEIEDVMPKIRIGEAVADLVPWESWLHPEAPNGYYMTAVVALDTANLENVVSSVAILANAGTIYSSTEALYVTDTEYDVRNSYRERTALHKFAFDQQGAAHYVASGAVSGRPLNQFSLGEHEGHLRIATHVQPTSAFGFEDDVSISSDGSVATAQTIDPTQPSNAVFVLGESSGELLVKGSIENIAPGERIYSARFLGDRGFLVTFKQIDPLFALDLSNPAAPRIAGELKIPGFSDYLHPLGENHLIGIGRSVATSPWGGTVAKSLQLSLFDVSDLSNPTLVQQIEVGGYGSSSEVSYDHKAFAFLAETNTLALAALLFPGDYNPYSNNFSDYQQPKSTVLFYTVDPAVGFSALGGLETVGDAFGYSYGSNRPAIIGETAYAVNVNGVRAAPLADLAATKTLVLEAIGDDFGASYFDSGFRGGAAASAGAAVDDSAAPVVSGETVP